jgi:hypothetical protein
VPSPTLFRKTWFSKKIGTLKYIFRIARTIIYVNNAFLWVCKSITISGEQSYSERSFAVICNRSLSHGFHLQVLILILIFVLYASQEDNVHSGPYNWFRLNSLCIPRIWYCVRNSEYDIDFVLVHYVDITLSSVSFLTASTLHTPMSMFPSLFFLPPEPFSSQKHWRNFKPKLKTTDVKRILSGAFFNCTRKRNPKIVTFKNFFLWYAYNIFALFRINTLNTWRNTGELDYHDKFNIQYSGILFLCTLWSEIWGLHSGEDSSRGLLGCDVV